METERLLRSLERRATLALDAPPARFRTELASLLTFIAEQDDLRALVGADLAREAAHIAARQASRQFADQQFAAQTVPLAPQLATLLADDALPPWVASFLASYDHHKAIASLEAAPDTPWAALEQLLRERGRCTGELARLLMQARDAELRCLALRRAEAQQSDMELTAALGRLWGHAFTPLRALPPPHWGDALTDEARRSWALSSRAVQRHNLLMSGDRSEGERQLHDELRQDVRRVVSLLADGLETRPSALPLLERFRRWCEQYERPDLLKRAKVGKKASETTRKRKEQELARQLLRALFDAGATPVTLAMLEAGGGLLARGDARPLLLEVRLCTGRDGMLRGYRECVQALRSAPAARLLAGECFYVAFLIDEGARFEEPPPLDLGALRLRSLFIDLTGAAAARQPLTAASIAAHVAEEDRLLEFLNTASESDLVALRGIGAAKAAQIIAHRPYTGASSMRAAGLPLSGALYDALRERALRGEQQFIAPPPPQQRERGVV